MTFGVVTVNYNNANLTRNLIESLAQRGGVEHFEIVVVDNASQEEDRKLLQEVQNDHPWVRLVMSNDNVGYFPGLNLGIELLRNETKPVNTIIVCNNDIEFPAEFFQTLENLAADTLSKFPIISPSIVTPLGRHQNPHVISHISTLRYLVWRIYYSNYTLARIIHRLAIATASATARRDCEQFYTGRIIDQGYGACYILTPMFFRHYEKLWAPTFLMGEEFFLSRQIRAIGSSVYYDPRIRVTHLDHRTVGTLPEKEIWEIARQSFKTYRVYKDYYG
ncbi:MAG: glycosyltransferase family 2 protein [Hyphomicrobiales bacterium]